MMLLMSLDRYNRQESNLCEEYLAPSYWGLPSRSSRHLSLLVGLADQPRRRASAQHEQEEHGDR